MFWVNKFIIRIRDKYFEDLSFLIVLNLSHRKYMNIPSQ